MSKLADNAYDLAICDPPYTDDFRTDVWIESAARQKEYPRHREILTGKKPGAEYFAELRRVSKHQIIWGGNYFQLPISGCWIVWNKKDSDNYFADAELAWTSFDKVTKAFNFKWSGMLQGDMKNKETRIHPTQKPVALYKWLLTKYAKPGWRILDTHLGSGSSAIAAVELKYEMLGCEIDEQYFATAVERIGRFKQQGVLL